jgi:hypothetical protein
MSGIKDETTIKRLMMNVLLINHGGAHEVIADITPPPRAHPPPHEQAPWLIP